MKNKKVIFLLLLVTLFERIQAQTVHSLDSAQGVDTFASAKKWNFIAEIYIMYASINGTMGLGTNPDSELDGSPGKVFDQFKIGANAYLEINNDRWAITNDFTYMKLGAQITPTADINHGDVELKQFGWELALLKKMLPCLEAGIATQLTSLKSDAYMNLNTMTGTEDKSSSFNKVWVDPSLITRVKVPLSPRFLFHARGNFGGFGIGSDLYWQLQAYLTYQLGNTILITAGYRVIDMDYEKGGGAERFKYDVTTFGPVLKFGLKF